MQFLIFNGNVNKNLIKYISLTIYFLTNTFVYNNKDINLLFDVESAHFCLKFRSLHEKHNLKCALSNDRLLVKGKKNL